MFRPLVLWISVSIRGDEDVRNNKIIGSAGLITAERGAGQRNRQGIFAATIFMLVLAFAMPRAQAQTFTALHQFNGALVGGLTDGANPEGALLRDASGNLFGTTNTGGIGEGTVFKLDSAGKETILLTFNFQVNGGSPASPLVQDASGNLYGIADGGPGGAGVLYRVSQQGDQTLLFQFQGGKGTQPKVPWGGILMDKSGNIFGTTLAGGKGNCLFGSGCGTVYKLDTAGVLRVLHNFNGGVGGSEPAGPLVQDAAGNLYGVAEQGGNLACAEFPQIGCGTVFKLAKNGVFTVLHTFQGGTDGAAPQPGLFRDSLGNIFGTTAKGGSTENGTVFKISSSGAFSVLHRFTGKDGTTPNGGLVADSLGNLFGTTQVGGANGLGTAFRLDAAGRVKILHSFTGNNDGASPLAGLILDAAGNLYGTTVKNFLIQQVQGGNVFVIGQ
jgi:uncharacterized repeat protein (TIGR03803 family)